MEFQSFETVWERLFRETRPILLYGMGDGADKILKVCEAYGIRISGVFASDEFVRGHSFAGFRVLKLSEAVEQFGENLVIAVSFGTARPEVLQKIYALAERFAVIAPDVPVIAGGKLFDRTFAQKYAEPLRAAYALMADEQSRLVFRNTVAYKLTGKLDYLRACETEKAEVFRTVLKPTAAEHFLDLGAYNGDTIRELLGYTDGCFASITALEPDRRTFKKLSRYTETLSGVVQAIQAGAWESDALLPFADKAGRNSALSSGGHMTVMRAADSVLSGTPCTLLKMDVEGAEREALRGVANTISRFAPRLNIACYHKSEDLFELPLLVHELNPAYRLYLRHHPYVPAWDTNLYAR